MGDHAYAYRGYSAYGDDDDRKDKTYRGGGSDKVCRTYITDSDGRQRTVVGCPPYYDTESYVVETEVTERFISPMISTGYRHGSPKKSDPFKDHGAYGSSYEKYRSPSSPTSYYDRDGRPKEVNDFLTGVQIEASRPNHYNQHNNGSAFGRPTVQPSTGYGGYGDYRKGQDYGGDSSDEEDGDEPYYYKPSGNVIRPEPAPIRPSPKTYGNDGGWSSPPSHGVGKLGQPTDKIEKVIDYLKGARRTDPVKPNGYGSDVKSTESVKPYGSTYESVKPYGSTYESVKPYGNTYESVKPYGSTYGSDIKGNTESVKPYGNTYESVKPYGGTYGSDIKGNTESVKPYSNTYESVKPYGSTYGSDIKGNTESVKPYGSTYGPAIKGNTESVKPYGYGSEVKVTDPVKPVHSSNSGSDFKKPDNVKSSEFVKPYGYGSDVKGSESVKPYSTYGSDYKTSSKAANPNGTKYPTTSTGQQVIDCYEAARMYNGKVIRT